MENLDKFDPEHLDDEEYEPLADVDRHAAELAMQERDRKEGRGQEKVLALKPSEDSSESEEEEPEETGKKQTTLFSFFKKIPKPSDAENSDTLAISKLKAEADAQAISHKVSAGSKKGEVSLKGKPGVGQATGVPMVARGPLHAQGEGGEEDGGGQGVQCLVLGRGYKILGS
eukprot:TRINITY_DN9550_c0_g1_i1.p1 TRINITY_DN9550_c0_g1~~TRINITY_DN9550_c0_g1_i1.p1  ORF type:complete len:172 (-),score=67.78 TRINITY_DN9550_c0_g1_i1:50-565(-)